MRMPPVLGPPFTALIVSMPRRLPLSPFPFQARLEGVLIL